MDTKKIIKDLSAISHEIQTPVNLISSTAVIINQKIEKKLTNDEELKCYMDNIINNCNKIAMLINNITEANVAYVSKIEHTNPKQFFDSFCKTVLPYCENAGAKIDFEFEVPNHIISIPTVTVERILLNLITNAIKYNDKKSKKIKLKMYYENGCILFSVKDNGMGISKNDINKVTEEFYRVNPQYSKGLGLGLSLVKKYLEQMNGTLNIKSQLQKGTKVVISIPNASEGNIFNTGETDYVYIPEKSAFNLEFSQIYSL